MKIDRRTFLGVGVVVGSEIFPPIRRSFSAHSPNQVPFVNGVDFGMRPSDGGPSPHQARTNTLALKAIRDMLQRGGAYRGGRIILPRGGVYFFDDEIRFDADPKEKVHNIYIEGEGPQSTVMDFALATPGKCGLKFGAGSGFGIRNIAIRRAPAHNIALIGGVSGGDGYAARGILENVRTQEAGGNGVLIENAFGLELRSIWATLNAGSGVRISGFTTTIAAYSCYSSDNKGIGWHLVGTIATALINCSADRNLYGFYIEGSSVVNILNGYSEECKKEAIYVRSSQLANFPEGLQTQVNGANLVKIDGFYALNNSDQGENHVANFLSVEGVADQEASVEYTGVWSSNRRAQTLGARFNGKRGRILRKPGLNRIQGEIVDEGNVEVL